MSESDIQKILDRLDKQDESLSNIKETLKPISEAYTTFSTLGKWIMGLALFVSIIIGSILGILRIIKK